MGGGAIFRGISKLVGAAATATASASTQLHAKPCLPDRSSPLYPCPTSIAAIPSSSSSSSSSSSCNNKPPLLSQPLYDGDGWGIVLQDRTDCNSPKQGHHHERQQQLCTILGSQPTATEVEEAIQELEAAVNICAGNPLAFSECGHHSFITASSDSQEVVFIAQDSPVYQAFHLLQTNLQVQNAVKSLACDEAVWKAVLCNEKVKELKQSLEGSEWGVSEDTGSAKGNNEMYESKLGLKSVFSIYDNIRCKISEIMGVIVGIINSISSRLLLWKKSSDQADKTLISCLMLAVAVLVVVLIKRVTVK